MCLCVLQTLASVCQGIQHITSALPYAEASTHTRQLFWGTVCATWLLTFVRQRGRRNFSIVDRVWPLFPVVLAAQWVYESRDSLFAAHEGAACAAQCKAIVGVVLVTVWGLRLCYNSVRRGDYNVGAEDYRWVHVRASIDRILPQCSAVRWAVWELFNIVFVSGFQLALLYLIAVPLHMLVRYPGVVARGTGNMAADKWSCAEVSLAALMAALLVLEAVADQQMYEFRQRKQQNKLTRAEAQAGFVHTGLWRYSRHPNVLCEQAFWAVLCVFCSMATGTDLGSLDNVYLLAGPVLLIALMWASVQLTESISRAKYPMYRAYMMQTSRLIPWKPWSNAQVINQAHAKL
ncbi:hypothetical protein J3B01_004517 [Coemansia erecta]|nr:hypothetical protein J3B01_004517 [Coemansia erecta]